MTRRKIVVLSAAIFSAAIVVALVATAGVYWIWQRQQWQAQLLRQATAQLNQTLPNTIANFKIVGPNLEGVARLDGDDTTVTFTVSNPSDHLLKDIAFDGLTLANVEPREKAELPLKIAELAPGRSQQFALHYDGLIWLANDIPPNRKNFEWAVKPLGYNHSWTAVVDPKAISNDSNVILQITESPNSGWYIGTPIHLDEKQARELKSRRDAGRKG